MRGVSYRLALASFVVLPSLLAAQGSAPPVNFLQVYREVVKTGKVAGHDALEAQWSWANVQAKAPPYIAARALTGSNEIWYISGYPGWAEYQQASDRTANTPALSAIDSRYRSQEDQFLSDARGMTLRSRPELSYGAPRDLPNMRYLSFTRVSVRPGHVAEYEEGRRMIKAAHEAAHLTDGFSIWEVTSGAPAGTFFTIVARKSLAELDSAAAVHGPAYTAALGGPDGQKKLDAINSNAVASSEVDHFEFVPAQSVPPEGWVTANPKMWKRSAPAVASAKKP